jgi:hypothetical protein
MDITCIGIGNVGSALADHLARAGHSVTITARDPASDSVVAAQKPNPTLRALPPAEAVAVAEVVFLATPYQANAAALAGLESALAARSWSIVPTPVGPGLSHGLEGKTSGAEEVQRLTPRAKVVKAFTIYGYENFIDTAYPGYGELKPTMLIAGEDPSAKSCTPAQRGLVLKHPRYLP